MCQGTLIAGKSVAFLFVLYHEEFAVFTFSLGALGSTDPTLLWLYPVVDTWDSGWCFSAGSDLSSLCCFSFALPCSSPRSWRPALWAVQAHGGGRPSERGPWGFLVPCGFGIPWDRAWQVGRWRRALASPQNTSVLHGTSFPTWGSAKLRAQSHQANINAPLDLILE